MAYEFTKLADAPLLDSVPTGANAFVETDGAVCRAPGAGLGGGMKTAVFTMTQDSESGVSTLASASNPTFSATCSMSYAEARALLLAGEALGVVFKTNVAPMMGGSGLAPASWYGMGAMFMDSSLINGMQLLDSAGDSGFTEGIIVQTAFAGETLMFYWLPDGTISTTNPG